MFCICRDFDGDEMNVHMLQDIRAVVEAKELVGVKEQILNAQNNKPCMGIVQDTLLGAYLLSSSDVFLTRGEVMQLLMQLTRQL